jgi:hypothetical protein
MPVLEFTREVCNPKRRTNLEAQQTTYNSTNSQPEKQATDK